MCGRFALGYNVDQIRQLCSYKHSHHKTDNKEIIPEWIDLFKDKKYKPSYNMSPGMLCPVIILNKHLDEIFDKSLDNTENISSTFTKRVITPMQWGLVPSWYKGDLKQFQLKTINCKSETLDSKPMFRNAIKNGRRCVVLAQGFYEWEKGTKQPYFIYSNENEVKYENLIKIAGIFDVWRDEKENKLIYTFSVITVDSKESPVGWIHERMPLILENEDEVDEWLDYEDYSFEKAKELFKPAKSIIYHAVSKNVNYTGYDSVDNIKEVKSSDSSKKSQTLIDSFVKKTSKLDIKSPRRSKSRSRSRSPPKRQRNN